MFFKKHLFLFLALSYCNSFFPALLAQEIPDTARVRYLKELEVEATSLPSSFKASSPLQILKTEDLVKTNSLQVSDAVKFFSGVQVKDYGGVGGIKTISIRSLGANHTAVAYDGIVLTDYQTGQIDLGRFSLENIEIISLNISEAGDIFQTARAQAAAGTLSIMSRKPLLTANKPFNIRSGIKAGSFGLINPYVICEQRLSKIFSMQILGEWMKTDGNFTFTQYYGYNNDSSALKKRDHSAIKRLNMETSLFGNFGKNRRLSLKLYYYDSDRELPGPVFNGNQVYHEKAWDKNFFVQAKYEQLVSEKIKFQTNGKFNFSTIDYSDFNDSYPSGKIENKYLQREYYFNTTVYYKPFSVIAFSWANDVSYGNFINNFNDCPFPSRIMWQSSMSGKFDTDRFTACASLLNTSVWEYVEIGEKPDNRYHISPDIGFSWKIFKYIPLRIRGFYKDIFRLPTFGDLYYARIGNRNLKPESVKQYDLGITWINSIGEYIPYLSLSADVYYNHVRDKIVAIPKNGLLIWSIENIGLVKIKGVDVNLNMRFRITDKNSLDLGATYTYQEAIDKTNPESPSYNQQIAYTPKNSVSFRAGLICKWFNLNYTNLYSGKRYDRNYNAPQYCLNPYSDQSISISRTFVFNKIKLFVSAACLNMFNEQYQIVKTYPLPGRSYQATVKFTY
ncbi:MAG: TonB-dependent receptor [Dysgonamonadaceae bacterium]|jgi:outer membrane cobalamin receptor|nr:TonB-dependent receptor [Dysgonamonadaceae bacterium]